MHGANPAPSSEHSNSAPAALLENAKRASVDEVAVDGASSISVSGSTGSGARGGSIVQRYSAGDASTFPAASVARTRNTCSPTASAP